jgi:hypothetical protein
LYSYFLFQDVYANDYSIDILYKGKVRTF